MTDSGRKNRKIQWILLSLTIFGLIFAFVSDFIIEFQTRKKYPIQRKLTLEEVERNCNHARDKSEIAQSQYKRAQEEALESAGIDPSDPVTYENFGDLTNAAASLVDDIPSYGNTSFWCKNVAPGSTVEEYLEDGEVFLRVIDKGPELSVDETENEKTFTHIKENFPINLIVITPKQNSGEVIGYEEGFTYGDGDYSTHKVIVKEWVDDFIGSGKWIETAYDPTELKLSSVEIVPENQDVLDSEETLSFSGESFQQAVLVAQDSQAQINIRVGPSTDTIARHYGLANDQVTILDQTRSEDDFIWYRVRFEESAAEGWVRGDFVRVTN
ncbi:SH3 domain-containing protein [Oscillatoria sp. CS-180]|uniref:SH3 domain-containing protein n=1 Tax=Oscillatoria sp. CS-180 TaxID=3021720 RepID=UPI00232EA364|nr:SH3 domain-containing protein [Oscillatoria sp. CS-180]MDB9524635.1 SH3 domain-containing protein [Oscillatoria sp. CS-180]